MNEDAKAFYSIAHRVLTVQGVKDALSHGANAIEVDLTAWEDGWWADHDSKKSLRRDTARDVFSAIADARRAGEVVTFVWFDIKTPDKYPPSSGQSESTFNALRALGREILEPVGVRVLYGFYETANCAALKSLNGTLTINEAVTFDGSVPECAKTFDANGIANISQRVLSRGLFHLDLPELGIFILGTFKPDVVVEFKTVRATLKQATESGRIGKTFGWTILKNQEYYVDELLYKARVDGLIHGFTRTDYADHADTRGAALTIREWVERHFDM